MLFDQSFSAYNAQLYSIIRHEIMLQSIGSVEKRALFPYSIFRKACLRARLSAKLPHCDVTTRFHMPQTIAVFLCNAATLNDLY